MRDETKRWIKKEAKKWLEATVCGLIWAAVAWALFIIALII